MTKKKSLLIDSILRGIDIPKIYLREMGNNSYEVADGQQRITSIIKFKNNELKLPNYEDKGLNLSKIEGNKVGGLKYEQLPKGLKNKFDKYNLTVAVVNNATGNQIRTLFGRLQEGINLNPAEKRNAIISTVGRHIDNFALNHQFFQNSRISSHRFKRQDYMAHVITLIAYNNNNALKADLILKLYLDKNFKMNPKHLKKVSGILDFMLDFDQNSSYRLYKKFHFIDLFWFLYKNYDCLDKISAPNIAGIFDSFEERRLDVEDAEELINQPHTSKENKMLYDYYMAFRYDGSAPENIDVRHMVYNSLFKKIGE